MAKAGKHLSDDEFDRVVEALKRLGVATLAAKETGIHRTTVQKIARKLREMGELGGKITSTNARRIIEKRGSAAGVETKKSVEEASPAEVRDASFWRRKATAETKRAEEAEHVLREVSGMMQRDLVVPDWTVPAQGATRRAAGLIHLSDLHVGEVVRKEEIGGVNEYSPDVFKRRFRRMIAAAIEILPRWSADCDLLGVVVALNGDLISGDIHDELRRTNALTAHEQVALASDEIAGGLSKLVDRFGSVLVTVTPGNHGRSTEKTHAKRMAALSYDTMIGNILARQFADDARVTINIASGPDILFPLFGWSILQTHGDSMGTGGGQGFAGPELPIVRGGKKVKLAGFASGERYDVILSAHYHTSSNPGTLLANGSMVGYSEYSQRIRGVPEPPMQWLALIHEKWGLRERVPVVLEDPRPPQRPRIRVPAGMEATS